MMTNDLFMSISKSINYLGTKEQAYNFYKKLAQSRFNVADKVEFALRHWGWNGEARIGAAEQIEEMKRKGFVIPPNGENFIQQFYNLVIPFKTSAVGAHINFNPFFSNEECIISEIMSIQFHVRMVDIGLVMYFYNDFNFESEHMEFQKTNQYYAFWSIELFLGTDGKVYYYEPDEGIAGILSENLLNFFSEIFGFPNAKKKGLEPLTEENALACTPLLDEIEEKLESGEYRPYDVK